MKTLLVLALVLVSGVAEAGHHCHETSRIVGRERCRDFASDWAHDPWLGMFGFEGALAFEHVEVHEVDLRGTVYSPTQMAGYHVALAPGTRHHLDALGPRIRVGYRAPDATLAVEITGAFAAASPTTVTTVDGFPPRPASGGSVFDATGVVGYHGRLGTLSLGGELAVGLRTIVLDASLPPGFTTCEGGATGKRCGLAPSEDRLLVEPRARVDWWLTPDVTVGLSGGVDLAARGGSLSAVVTWHIAAYDGS